MVVASFAEAWIEIVLSNPKIALTLSPPSRRRGLKWINGRNRSYRSLSPPSRRRGLKSCNIRILRNKNFVASFAEAWIEIQMALHGTLHVSVASFAEAWIEMMFSILFSSMVFVASFAEAWIEIISQPSAPTPAVSSPPSRRRGLKFYTELDMAIIVTVASFAEAWIEISLWT